MTMARVFVRAATLVLFVAGAAAAWNGQAQTPNLKPLAPYAGLIGTWDFTPEQGGAVVAVEEFRWGANQSYIAQTTSLVINGKTEPHFKGVMVWNGINRNVDYLFVVDMKYGLAQERGTYAVQADGSIVREVIATYAEGVRPVGLPIAGPAGASQQFRQTFKPLPDGRMATSLMRKTDSGWVPTFPGADRLVMTRRVGS